MALYPMDGQSVIMRIVHHWCFGNLYMFPQFQIVISMAKIVQQKAKATHWQDMKCLTPVFPCLGQMDVLNELQINFKYTF